mmetsp:Transcript_832/g.2841  ORF Transcript_832/g.2841 Transcript_832/m.2841 type:complete len:394 (+) Transcript_832:755-1936(+)
MGPDVLRGPPRVGQPRGEPLGEGVGGYLSVVGPKHLAVVPDELLLRICCCIYERVRQQHLHPARTWSRLGGRTSCSHGSHRGNPLGSPRRAEQEGGQGPAHRPWCLLLLGRPVVPLHAGVLQRLGPLAGHAVPAAGHGQGGLRVHQQGNFLGLLRGPGRRERLCELHASVLLVLCHLLLLADKSDRLHPCAHRPGPRGRHAAELRLRPLGAAAARPGAGAGEAAGPDGRSGARGGRPAEGGSLRGPAPRRRTAAVAARRGTRAERGRGDRRARSTTGASAPSALERPMAFAAHLSRGGPLACICSLHFRLLLCRIRPRLFLHLGVHTGHRPMYSLLLKLSGWHFSRCLRSHVSPGFRFSGRVPMKRVHGGCIPMLASFRPFGACRCMVALAPF